MNELDINLDTSRHLEELKQLKDVDYEFYKYLEEHGSDLLNPVGFGEEKEVEIEENDEELLGSEFGLPRLDRRMFNDVKENLESTKSFKGLSILLSYFRSVANMSTKFNEDAPVRSEIEKSKKKGSKENLAETRSRHKERTATFYIDDPEFMFEITVYVLEKVPELFWFHSSGGGKDQDRLTHDILPENLPKWLKVEKLCKTFWQDLSNLILNNCLSLQPNLEFMQDVFRMLSNSKLIVWLIPNRLLTNRFSTLLSRVWTMNKYIVLKQGAFQVLKAMNARFYQLSQRSAKKDGQKFEFTDDEDIVGHPVKRHEEFLLILHRTIGISAMRGISWKNYSSSAQVVDDYLILLQESEHSMVYRIAYNVIRKLGSMLRVLYLRISRANSTKNSRSNSAKQKKLFEEVFVNLFSWKFLTYIRIWSLAVSKISVLYPLQYPLITIITSISRLKLSSISFLPYTLQTLEILTEMASSNRVLIPISEMLFDVHSTIERGFKQAFSKSSQNSLKSQSMITAASKPFLPELEIKIGNSISKSYQVYDSLQEFWAYVLSLYISSLYLHPSFPEFLLGIVPDLKKLQKYNSKYWNDHVSKQIKDIIKRAEAHSEKIQNLRITVLTNKGFLELLSNQSSSNKSQLPPYSSKVYNEYVYDSMSSTDFTEFEIYLNDLRTKRAELVKGKIKLSSMRALGNAQDVDSTGDHHLHYIEGDQEDIEFKILLQQLHKAGKSIDDIKNLGPRQLKKLKKSIKNQIINCRESLPSTIDNYSTSKSKKRSSEATKTQSCNTNKKSKIPREEVEKVEDSSTKQSTNTSAREDYPSNTTQHDIIEDWDINSED